MSTKQTVTSEQSKEKAKPSRKKYKETTHTGLLKTLAKKKSSGDATREKKRTASSSQRRSKSAEKTTKPSKSKKENGTDKRTRKEQKKRQKEEKKANKRSLRRIFPIWLRLIVIPLLCIVALLLGVMVGYGVIGEGSPFDALHKETWQHIIDIVKSK